MRLVVLVMACMVPTVAAAVAAILYVYQQERSGFERTLAEAGRALSLVVDRELARREATLRALAESPALTKGDLATFYDYARRIAPTGEAVVVLADLNGQQLLNTRRPLGGPLPGTVFTDARREGGETQTLVSNLYFAPIGRQYSFAVQVPVVRAGKVLYYLSMGSYASQMQKVIADQRLPDGWIATILDREGAIVARSDGPGEWIGRKPPASTLAQLHAHQGGVVQVPSMTGEPLTGSFSRTPNYGWGTFIGLPKSHTTSPGRTAASVAAVAALLLAAAFWFAVRVGRRLVRPITTLAAAAETLGRGEPVTLVPTGLKETDQVSRALARASDSLASAKQLMEQRVQEALIDADKAHRAMVQNQRLEAIGQLTGGVAHDFNNLLMVVNTNVHLLRTRRPELAEDPQLARISRSVATGSKLTRQLLAFARRQPLRPRVVDLAGSLPELVDLVRPTLSSRVTATCEVAPETGCVEVDPAELELALINLAVNARDAMPEGGTLAIRAAARLVDGRQMVAIEVSDTGHGIEPEVLARVFEPFFTTKEVGRGTGLGLSQVYGFTVQANGTTTVHSTPGAGTTVTMLLPQVRCAPPAAESVGGLERLPQGCSLLLVEDNAELAQSTRELLVQAGCAVQHAASAAQALAALRARDTLPDVVLSDVRMPGEMDGIGLALHLREHHAGLPVILMTGYTGELTAAREAGLAVLAKPLAPHRLLAAVAAAMRPPAAA
jgi:signal transduction histidine kinase/CheY-like chemotaxis protein